VIVGAHILLAPPAEVAKVPPSFQPKVALSELLRKADSAIPNGVTTSVSFPDAQTIVVAKKLPQDHARFYFSSVTLDGLTGQILEVNQVSDPVPMWKFLMAIADLHFGTFGGLPTRILYLFLGCMPTLLFATGLVNWRRRRRPPTRQEQELSLPKQTQANTVP
jgi:uncharacterized iron-regulated membrane protein